MLPVAGANNLSTDDISTLVAYGDAGGRKIGVLVEQPERLTPSTSPATSTARATPQPAGPGPRCARRTLCPDDHLNIKSIDADTSGHIYAAVKTSLNDKNPTVASDPLIVIYRLNTAGGWSSSIAWRWPRT